MPPQLRLIDWVILGLLVLILGRVEHSNVVSALGVLTICFFGYRMMR